MLTSFDATIAAGTSGPEEVTIFMTPGGKPASLIASPNLKIPSGSCGAGFMMQVLPIARAGAIFPATLVRGKL